MPTDATLAGGPNAVWIFQIAGNLTVAGAAKLILSGGAQPKNIFWQVAGGVGVDLGTTSQFDGIIISQAGINLQTGASINGRLLAQTAVTLDANSVTAPTTPPSPPSFGRIARAPDGNVTLVLTNTPGLEVTFQYSTDLVHWTSLLTMTPSSSPWVTNDTTASAVAMRFYRAFYP